MSEKDKLVISHSRELAAEQARLLAMEPQEALDALLSHPRAGALVRTMPREDLYVLVAEIGPDDCIEVLAMASPDQWRFFLDMDGWRDDQLDWRGTDEWLERLYRVDSERLAAMLAGEERELFELWLNANVTVIPLTEHDDPSDLKGEAFTLDGALYLKPHFPPGMPDADRERLRALLTGLLRRVAEQDFALYQAIAMEASGVVAAETREDLFRLRNVRLAELGFAPAFEAVAVYQHLTSAELLGGPSRVLSAEGPEEPGPALLLPESADAAQAFSQALARVSDAHALWALQSEFAGLCNLILSADRVRVRAREDLAKAVRKAAGYVSLGLDELAGADAAGAAQILSSRPLSAVFRVGYSRALDLKFAAERFRREAWVTKNRIPLTFFGERYLGVLGGLLLPRPRFFANYETGLLYREFETPEDIAATAGALEEIGAVDGLFEQLMLPPGLTAVQAMTWDRALLSLFARKKLGLESKAAPLALAELAKLWPRLWSGRGRNRAISVKTRQDFSGFISGQAQTAPGREPISPALARAFDSLFTTLSNEYAKVAAKDLDPRFLPHFWVEAK